jgi:short-subunit dehydrogenase
MDDNRPFAVVTGASSGIGSELAGQFARHGYDLLLTARDEDRLNQVAARCRVAGAQTVTVAADLRTYDGVERLYAEIRASGRPVDAAALNAGAGHGGPFTETDLADETAVIDLNVTSTVHLAKRLLKDMTARGSGRMLFVSSVASTLPGTYQAVYNASKSFVQSFAQALREELRGTGVSVTSVMPGPTETDFFRRAGMEDTRIGRSSKDDPAQVAGQAFRALMRGSNKVFAGSAQTRAQGVVGTVVPDRLKAAVHRRMAEPGSGTGPRRGRPRS